MTSLPAQVKSYEDLQNEVLELRQENERLWQQIKLLKKYVFGQKSERQPAVDIEQGQLFPTEITIVEEPEVATPISAHVRKGGGRKALPADLPRERIEYEPEEKDCGNCGVPLERIGEEITTELDYVPARFVIREHVKIKRACSKCKEAGVKTGKLPPALQPIERGRPGAGLLVHVMVSKYCDHIPLNRLENIFAREGVNIPRQRMCDWLREMAEQLRPLAVAILKLLLEHDYLQADETTIKVQLDELAGKLHTGYFWAIHGPPNMVYYHYAPSRASEVPKELLADFTGVLQTDAYAGYNPIYLPDKCYRLACLAHIRRKLLEANAAANKHGTQAIKLIQQLYRVEREAKELKCEEAERLAKRHELRQQKSLPLLEQFFQILGAIKERYLPKNLLRQAAEYALEQRVEMFRFLDDPRFEIDNNSIERLMRPIAVGRKNYLFAGSHAGAEWAAIFYTLINCCKLNGVNPTNYLRDVLCRIHSHPASRINELLPFNSKPAD